MQAACDWTLHPWHHNNVGGVNAGQARDNSSNVGGVTAGQVRHNSSTVETANHLVRHIRAATLACKMNMFVKTH